MTHNITLYYNDIMNVAGDDFRKAWELQAEIAGMRKRLTEKETELKELTESLKGASDEIFAVANLRPYRIVNTEWVRDNMPDVYERLVKVSDTNTGKILHATYTREQVNQYLQEQNPDMFDRVATISITDLEKELGKTKTRELEGTAVRTEMRVVSGTQIVLKHPEKYDALPEGKNDEEDEE